ncbi:TIGR03619 family F420-dependent LLM class oxidoreductase [Streptomyces triticagri]|uniref:TIGR03619 family F420-dependent LLM class oxidoreductase n=1 Tax=Streptomyces triticagri TaxID=2293568 RepID=A0A372M240_9ACTN|nr:TIGR03619 family F420-dependent LLM class oxidoreductase [Streptomyces triticagri]RFU84575.1 TIGR03619 family F420-dependent LLM class oxidoreductase [Streptomyces triticagri]
MQFTVEYPISAAGHDPAVASGAGVLEIVRAAEQCGYDAIAFTEHPAPSRKWLDAGGHATFDAIAALGFCAAATERIRLMTYLLVLPYHNPLAAAKALGTVDVLSGGRVTVVAGTGYLRSEFRALGVDFDERNALFDEAAEVLRGVWSTTPYAYRGRHFEAGGVAQVPPPVQAGGPPLWIGGNSALARRRAARHQGWSPMMVSDEVARTARTPALASVAELARLVGSVRESAVELRGAGARVEVQVQTPEGSWPVDGGSVERHRDHLGQLAQAGVTSFVLRLPGSSVGAAVEALRRYADTFGL